MVIFFIALPSQTGTPVWFEPEPSRADGKIPASFSTGLG
jgi:hypothetical protein